ncbi:hypothetical protein FGG08_005873 [Glutinoglossum americanum]|uniref:GATA-type domain-containing protein n=1 Tax=Glutinoglossum americanum TaxID=1670608 RepID=A0A9P8HTR2_9PEZI|nr:hypothetical protein FGG08_005873 [Glutinoglossum americanum]
MPSTAPISPTSMYSGPPPPYSNPISSSASSVPSFSGLISPPDSRRTSGDDKEPPKPQRQSLPSLHEALNSEQPLPYNAPASTSIHPQSNPPSSVVSPTTPIPRSYPHDNHSGQRSQSQGSLSLPTQNQHPPLGHSAQHLYAQQEFPNVPPSNYTRNHSLPSLPSIRPVHQNTHPQQTSPQYEPGSNPPPMNSHFSYPGYPPQYSAPSQPPGGPHGGYQPPGPYNSQAGYSPRTEPTYARTVDSRHVEEARAYGKTEGERFGQFGLSVKRHLDIFDLEASLGEIMGLSAAIYNYSNRYRGLSAESQRTPGNPSHMPIPSEIDEMVEQSKRTYETFVHIKEVLQVQQTTADHRVPESSYKSSTEYEMEDAGIYQDDMKSNGLMGPDPKKRRGRAAPPGRCHSCNRAETPEWRRGPDGARTLCNACGLHYAKLTRKMGPKQQQLGGSSLRPKTMAPGSPRQ